MCVHAPTLYKLVQKADQSHQCSFRLLPHSHPHTYKPVVTLRTIIMCKTSAFTSLLPVYGCWKWFSCMVITSSIILELAKFLACIDLMNQQNVDLAASRPCDIRELLIHVHYNARLQVHVNHCKCKIMTLVVTTCGLLNCIPCSVRAYM